MQFMQGLLLAGLGLGLTACHTAAVAENRTSLAPRVALSEPAAAPSSAALGAGDALGQRIFTRAVALARAENPTGWRFAQASAEDRALFPAFDGRETLASVHTDLNDSWILSTLLDVAARPVPATEFQTPAVTSPPQVIVLVPEEQ